MKKIPIAGPWVTEHEVSAVAEAAEKGWYQNAAHYVQSFEQAFADYLGVRHAIAVPHCTSAIHLALASLNIGRGDEVIVPDITWIATAAPVDYVGAVPVFADIDKITWCIDPESVRRCITGNTKAIIAVGLYGLSPDMGALSEIAESYGISLIEDAAQTLGSSYNNQMSGSFGDVGVFSFHGTKLLTTGEGGMFVTNDEELFERAQVLRDHGRTKANFRNFYNTEVAFKYRMSSLQAAFGRAQLDRIDELIQRKRDIFGWYFSRLNEIPGVSLNSEPSGYFNTYWMTTIVLDPAFSISSQDLMAKFEKENIDVRPFFHPLSSLPAYAGHFNASRARELCPVAYDISPRAVNLPSAMVLEEDDVDRVCHVLRNCLDSA